MDNEDDDEEEQEQVHRKQIKKRYRKRERKNRLDRQQKTQQRMMQAKKCHQTRRNEMFPWDDEREREREGWMLKELEFGLLSLVVSVAVVVVFFTSWEKKK